MKISIDTMNVLRSVGCKKAEIVLNNAEYYSFFKDEVSCFHLETIVDDNDVEQELMYFVPGS